MHRAIELAALGEGYVEPNPMVGAVLVDDSLNLIGEGHHEHFGGPHAEISAIDRAGARANGATLFVTLEPCCHQGKTGPCTKAIIDAGIRRVVIGMSDPAPHIDGGGIAALEAAGIEVEVGLLKDRARRLAAPFVKLFTTGNPYVIAKWAMTLDGKIAARTGASRWISNEASRRVVHKLRGRMDAILIGARTASVDDPLLTPRPAGQRTPTRVVLDSRAALSLDSQLVRTRDQSPVIVVASTAADAGNVHRLEQASVEVLQFAGDETATRAAQQIPGPARRPGLAQLLDELGRRQMTNVLVEGGGQLLGALFDAELVDEVHAFIAPSVVGGQNAVEPVAGIGLAEIPRLPTLLSPEIEILDGDVYIHGPIRRETHGET